MNENFNKEVKKLKPFTKFIYTIGELPSSYLFSMTYEEQLIWLCNYIAETVIPTVNNNGEAVEELQGLYVELKDYVDNYFDNLDVQTEIDNKLDDMVESGELEALFKPYLDTYIQPQINQLVEDINTVENDLNVAVDTIENEIHDSITDVENDLNQAIGDLQESVDTRINTQNVRIADVESLVDGATSGTPLVASSTAGMTDTSKIYVNTSDGNWYYYNGASWAIGGVYQATGISDSEQVPYKNIEFKSSLVDLSTITDWATFSGNSSRTINGDGSLTIAVMSNDVGGVQFTVPRGKKYLIEVKCKNDTNIKTGWFLQNWNTFQLDLQIGNGINIGYLDLSSDPSVSNTIAIYAYFAYQITIEYIKLYEIDDINETNVSRNDLEYFINNYEKLIKYNNVEEVQSKINNSLIKQWTGTGSLTSLYKIQDEVHLEGSGQIGFYYTKVIENSNNILKIKYTANIDGLRAYFINADNQTIIYSTEPSVADQEMDISVDLNNLTIYSSLPETFRILFAYPETGSHTITVSDIYIYKNDIEDNVLYDNKLSNMLNNIMTSINNNSSDITKYNNLSKNYLISPNGTKYKLTVDNSGNLSTVTFNPTKALYIGNSLLRGFVTHGMASSNVNTDYYALINSYLTSTNPSFTATKVPTSDIETATTEAAGEAWVDSTMTTYMDAETDLVIIQLGDNTANSQAARSVFVHNMNYLIEAIQTVNPNAEILLVGVWYNASVMMPLLNEIASDNPSITLVDISDLNIRTNQSYIGATYIDENGDPQTITSAGVASHPSDVGFRKIADRIIYNI